MDQCFELGYYSNGAFSMMDAYELPVNVRSYYYAKLVNLKEQEIKQAEANQNMKR